MKFMNDIVKAELTYEQWARVIGGLQSLAKVVKDPDLNYEQLADKLLLQVGSTLPDNPLPNA